jgi:hypothetical protein
MKAMLKTVSCLAIVVALSLSGSHVFSKGGGGGASPPGQVKTSGSSAAPSGGSGGSARPTHLCSKNPQPGCSNYVPGHTQPACRGGHMGPNGVMVQCN